MKGVIFNENALSELRCSVAMRMSDYRFKHTLGVEQMVIRLGEILMPERITELRVAAILHDVAKEMDIDEQLYLVDNCDKINKTEKSIVPQALHSFAGVAIVINDFPGFALDDILDAIKNHTLGNENMSLFSEILFVSDYIEEGRAYFESISVRNVLFDKISRAGSIDERIKALHFATVLCINNTLESLKRRGLVPDERSIKTKKAFEALI